MPLSVRVIKLEVTSLLSGRVLSVNFFRSCCLPNTTLDGSLIVLLVVPRCNIIRAFFQQWVDIIAHIIDCSSREVFNFDLSIPSWNNFLLNARQHWITNYDCGISTLFLKLFIRIRWYISGILICVISLAVSNEIH